LRRSVERFLRAAGLRIPDKRVLERLVEESHLTMPQAEALLIEAAQSIMGRRMSIEEKARIRGVSKGAYSRTRKQALENIKRSIYTLLLLRLLGILGEGAAATIIEAGELLARGEYGEALSLIESLTPHDITE